MRITDVQAFLLSSPMPEPIVMEYYGGLRTIFKRDAALVRIQTDGGLTGYGPAPASEEMAETINSLIRDALIGADPDTLHPPLGGRGGRDTGQTEALRARVLSGANLQLSLAFGGVEIALYDLRGKMEGCPVYELLGGKVRDRIRLYGSAGMYQSPESYAREAAAVAGLGFSAYKMRPALGLEEDLRTVQLMRQAVGPDVGLCVDAHAWWRMGDRSYTPDQIEQLAREMAAYNITWLEEPLPPEDRTAYIRLREAGIVPIAAGEHETSYDGFMEIISQGAVDIAQADVPHQGGFLAVKKILEACAKYGRQFAFHNWGTLLECIADAHLGVCFPEAVCPWLEYPCFSHRGQEIMYPYPLADEILKEPLAIENGEMLIPDGPGLGVEVDDSVVERYPYISGPWSTFRLSEMPRSGGGHGSSEEMHLGGDHTAMWDKNG
jgi:L-alanine-DL-glutamate epimerase-like enolase superfamily enzyme